MDFAVERMSNPHTHVLLIEDSPADADLVRTRLLEGNSDLEVSCADRLSTGLAALALKPPAVVLLDLNLPDSHGAQTFRNVRNQAPGIPVVVLSGVDDEELAAQAVHEGVQDYLVKGAFDSKQLTRTLLFAIERQSLLPPLDMSRTQPVARPLEETERCTIIQAVNKVGVLKAARLLGIGKTTVYRKLKLYQVLLPGRKSPEESLEVISGHGKVIESGQKFDLWKEYFSDMIRKTAEAHAQGATQEEVEKRVEQWLVAKYADKFYPTSAQTANCGKDHASEGAAMTLRSPNRRPLT
jgi:DNA-binding response OmpR family regulator